MFTAALFTISQKIEATQVSIKSWIDFLKNVFTYNSIACVHAKSLQSCPTLCHPMDHSPQGSSVHGILQARILECRLPCLLPGDLSNPRIEPTSLRSPALAGGFFTTSATWEASNTTVLLSLKK